MRASTPSLSRRNFGLGAIFAATAAAALAPRTAFAKAAEPGMERFDLKLDDREIRSVAGVPDARFFSDCIEGYRQALGTSRLVAEDPWLVLSGGGDNGAFGAGLLVGWSESGERPRFGVVTGISTGALIAPFAFAGAAYDGLLRDCYTTITAADIFEFGETPESLVDTWPLARMIERQVTQGLLDDIADQHRLGRRLFVQTTHVDTERGVVWNMGAIAARGGPEALALFRRILLASASIPGVFPPVYIEAEGTVRRVTEMHVDGGVTTPFYVAPETVITGSVAGVVPARRIYVLVNNQLAPEFLVTPRMTLTVLGKSLSAAVKAASRAAIALHRAFARDTGIDLQVASVGSDFTATTTSPFDPSNMKALFDYGARKAMTRTAFAPEARPTVLVRLQ